MTLPETILQHEDTLKRFALRLTKHSLVDAEDLVQETILKALLHPISSDNPKILAYLFSIMRNSFITQYKRKKISPMLFSEKAHNEYIISETQLADSKTIVKEILNAINSLPKKLSQALTLRIEGYKYKEIAEKTNTPINTVKSRIRVAREILKQRLL